MWFYVMIISQSEGLELNHKFSKWILEDMPQNRQQKVIVCS